MTQHVSSNLLLAAAPAKVPSDEYEPVTGKDQETVQCVRACEAEAAEKTASDYSHVVWAYGVIWALFASPEAYQYNPIKTIKTSTVGMVNIMGLAKRCGARILHASTSEVYGDPTIHPQTEDYWGHVNPIGPRSAMTKASGSLSLC